MASAILIIGAVLWLIGCTVFLLALGRAAKRGDAGLSRQHQHDELRRLRGH